MKPFFTVLFLLMLTACVAQKTTFFADSILTTYPIPEISYAVIDSKTTWEIAALGKHSAERSDSASLQDRFHLGSNTKALTAFVIAKYVEKKKLKWTTKFFDVFPQWKTGSRGEYFNITLQELLSHRAGIQPFQGENDPPVPGFKGTRQEQRCQFGRFVLSLQPVRPHSTNKFIYSNAGYTLASLILEKVTGKSWEQLIEKVFNTDLKLQLKLSWPDNQQHNDTWGHSFENGKLTPIPSTVDYHLDFTEPAGDINSTLEDYIQFIRLNLQGLQGHNNYLTAKTYQFLHKGVENYAMGWYNIQENGRELSTHSGTAGTYYTLVHIDRTTAMAYIIFTNSFSPETQQGVRLLMRKLKENYNGLQAARQ